MTDQPATLATAQALEYIRDHTGRTTTPNRTQLNKWHHAPGGITPYRSGNARRENTYLVSDLADLCEKINSSYWRKLRWENWREKQGESN